MVGWNNYIGLKLSIQFFQSLLTSVEYTSYLLPSSVLTNKFICITTTNTQLYFVYFIGIDAIATSILNVPIPNSDG